MKLRFDLKESTICLGVRPLGGASRCASLNRASRLGGCLVLEVQPKEDVLG